MSKNELEVRPDDAVISSLNTRAEFQILLDSGALPSSFDNIDKIMAVAQMGRELGLPVMVSINNINIIKGRTVISSTMLGAMLKARNIEWTWVKDFFTEADGKIITRIEFEAISKVSKKPKVYPFEVSWGQMEVAGYTDKQNWEKYPKEMMRARCMAYGVRAYFPEVLMGMYTDTEMLDATDTRVDMRINEEGDIEVIEDAEEI